VPAAIAWGLKRWLGVPYLFDIRGLQAEEYVDAGHWKPLEVRFWLTKHVEQWFLHDADGLVTLTEAIRPILRDFPGLISRPALPPWEVIPCCVDLDHFRFQEEGRKRVRAELEVGNRPVLVYAGSIGTWYLLDEMLEFYVVARRMWPELFFLFLPNASHEVVRSALRRHGVFEGKDAAIRWARFEEMPDYLSAADAGVAFIRPCVSKRSSSPTKYAEYLACGLPLVVNSGIGDVDSLVKKERAGVVVQAFDRETYSCAAEELRGRLLRKRDAFRDIAERHFSLSDRAYHAYRGLYEQILARRHTGECLS
jgi:glycosyltransferase involved in cell wall biosynthesis